MNWDDARFFLAVCRRGSVSAAGKQLVVRSRYWGFTDILRSEYEQLRDEKQLDNRGGHSKRIAPKGAIGFKNVWVQ